MKYSIPADQADGSFSVSLDKVTDSEGDAIPASEFSIAVVSDNSRAFAFPDFDPSTSKGSFHVGSPNSDGSPAVANVRADVIENATGKNLGPLAAATIVVSHGQPTAFSGTFAFDGLTPDPEVSTDSGTGNDTGTGSADTGASGTGTGGGAASDLGASAGDLGADAGTGTADTGAASEPAATSDLNVGGTGTESSAATDTGTSSNADITGADAGASSEPAASSEPVASEAPTTSEQGNNPVPNVDPFA